MRQSCWESRRAAGPHAPGCRRRCLLGGCVVACWAEGRQAASQRAASATPAALPAGGVLGVLAGFLRHGCRRGVLLVWGWHCLAGGAANYTDKLAVLVDAGHGAWHYPLPRRRGGGGRPPGTPGFLFCFLLRFWQACEVAGGIARPCACFTGGIARPPVQLVMDAPLSQQLRLHLPKLLLWLLMEGCVVVKVQDW